MVAFIVPYTYRLPPSTARTILAEYSRIAVRRLSSGCERSERSSNAKQSAGLTDGSLETASLLARRSRSRARRSPSDTRRRHGLARDEFRGTRRRTAIPRRSARYIGKPRHFDNVSSLAKSPSHARGLRCSVSAGVLHALCDAHVRTAAIVALDRYGGPRSVAASAGGLVADGTRLP